MKRIAIPYTSATRFRTVFHYCNTAMLSLALLILEFYRSYQSMGVFPISTRASLTLEKHPEVKNGDAVFVAPSGDG